MPADRNLAVYRSSHVVRYYTELEGLQEAEITVFRKYLRPAIRVLDLGVGGGRTTPYLSSSASEYVGIDFCEEMIETCRKRFPQYDFYCLDASDLQRFADRSFDAVVFSFNGLGYLNPDDKRQACLLECARVLVPNGLFIFSLHNARNILVKPIFQNASAVKLIWRCVRAAYKTVMLATRLLSNSAFWSGAGYTIDPVHGGLKVAVMTPERVCGELARTGFAMRDVVSGPNSNTGPLATAWYYYVSQKVGPTFVANHATNDALTPDSGTADLNLDGLACDHDS